MSITVTEIGDAYTGIARRINGNGNPGGNSADVTISGTYAAETPTNIYYRILNHSDDSPATSWAILDSSPSGGTFSGTASQVPQGGHYKAEVKVDEAGNTDTTSNKWCVGLSICGFGQSKIAGSDTGGVVVDPNDLACQYYYGSLAWRKLIDYWNGSPQGGETSPITSFINYLITELSYPVFFGGYSQGGSGLVEDGSGKWTDRNAGNPSDTSTLYGKFLTVALVMTPEFVMIDIGDGDAVTGQSKANVKAAVEDIHDWLETDLGYRPKLLLIPCGRNEQGAGYAQGYDDFQTAFQELHNGTDIFHLSPRYQLELLADGLHDPTPSQRLLGESNARALLRVLNGEESRPGYIADANISGDNIVIETVLPSGMNLIGNNRTGLETKDAFIPDYTTVSSGKNVEMRVKQRLNSNHILRYAYGNNPLYSSPIINNEGDAILQHHSNIALSGGVMSIINGINMTDEDFTLFFANWANGPTTKQSGNYPSSPNGAYQNCVIMNSGAAGDGFVQNTPGEGWFKVTFANQGHIATDHQLGVSNDSKFTAWAWLTHLPNNTNNVNLCGNHVDSNNYWFVQIIDNAGWKRIRVYFEVGGTLKYADSVTGVIPTSNDEDLYLVMIEKDGATIKLYIWNSVHSGEVSYSHQDTFNQGVYTYGTTDVGKYHVSYATCKLHEFGIISNVFTAAEKTTIYNAGKDLGWHGYNSGDVMHLLDNGMLEEDEIRSNLKVGCSIGGFR